MACSLAMRSGRASVRPAKVCLAWATASPISLLAASTSSARAGEVEPEMPRKATTRATALMGARRNQDHPGDHYGSSASPQSLALSPSALSPTARLVIWMPYFYKICAIGCVRRCQADRGAATWTPSALLMAVTIRFCSMRASSRRVRWEMSVMSATAGWAPDIGSAAGRLRRSARSCQTMTARSMQFCSSRMLPGQAYSVIAFRRGGGKTGDPLAHVGTQDFDEMAGQHRDVLEPWRSGGKAMGKTFRR